MDPTVSGFLTHPAGRRAVCYTTAETVVFAATSLSVIGIALFIGFTIGSSSLPEWGLWAVAAVTVPGVLAGVSLGMLRRRAASVAGDAFRAAVVADVEARYGVILPSEGRSRVQATLHPQIFAAHTSAGDGVNVFVHFESAEARAQVEILHRPPLDVASF